MKAKKKQVKRRKKSGSALPSMIDFTFANTSYQIDPARRKVYHRWIEVETAKTCLIMGAFSSEQAQAK